MLIEYLNFTCVSLALLGAILNANQRRLGFILWIISNTSLSILSIYKFEFSLALLFFCYLLISFYGYVYWKENEKENKWTSIEKKLPPAFDLVILFGDNGILRGYRDKCDSTPSWFYASLDSFSSDEIVFGVTHWMPLPEEPQD